MLFLTYIGWDYFNAFNRYVFRMQYPLRRYVVQKTGFFVLSINSNKNKNVVHCERI